MDQREATEKLFRFCKFNGIEMAGHVKEARILIEQHGVDVNARDEDGHTPLHHAAAYGVELCRLLLAHGAEVDAVAKNGRTPLLVAAANNFMAACRLLLEHGADPDIADHTGTKPRDWEFMEELLAEMKETATFGQKQDDKKRDTQMRAALKKRSRFEPRPDNLDRTR